MVLCQVARALRLSEISILICRGRFMEVFVVGIGEEEDQAASCIDLVRRCTASSISFGDFKLILRLHRLSRDDLNFAQSIWPRMRLSCFGLVRGAV